MKLIEAVKQWIRSLGLKESEVIIDEETYKALQTKYDKTDSKYNTLKNKYTILESEKDYLNKQLTELKTKYDEVKDYNAQIKFEFKPDKPEKPKKQVKQKKRKTRPIVYGKEPKTGVIKDYDKYHLLYVRDPVNKKIYQKKGELNPLKKALDIFNERGNPYDEFYTICGEIVPDRRFTVEEKYIYKYSGRYVVRRNSTTNNKSINLNFGTYATLERAKEVRDYLMFVDWDISYLPRNVCSKTKCKPNSDEYYTLMKVYIETDSKYQEYLGNKETKEFYD